jgi:hypothetical protein
MAIFRTHYDNLKAVRNAPLSVIEAAYKAVCKTYLSANFQGSQGAFERIMKIILQSYPALLGSVKRAEHDELLIQIRLLNQR